LECNLSYLSHKQDARVSSLYEFYSPDRSKLPCSADSGTSRVLAIQQLLPNI
jgi:hypothetical protein